MQKFFKVLSSILAMAPLSMGAAFAQFEISPGEIQGKAFPPVTAKNWKQKSVIVPTDLHNQCTCLFVAFDKLHHEQVATWIPFLVSMEKEHKGFRYAELFALPVKFSPTRLLAETKITKNIRDDFTKSRILTSCGQDRTITDKIHLHKELMYFFLLDSNNKIICGYTGPFSEQSSEDIKKRLSENEE